MGKISLKKKKRKKKWVFFGYKLEPMLKQVLIMIGFHIKGSRMGSLSGDFQRGGESERSIPYFSALSL